MVKSGGVGNGVFENSLTLAQNVEAAIADGACCDRFSTTSLDALGVT